MRHHKLFYGSSYDRGLDVLLDLWPQIIEKFPDATLDVCYGWDLFDKVTSGNPERLEWKNRVTKQMSQKGITHHGRVGKQELERIRSSCGIWAYPTYFTEIFCITAVEAQADGLVPVTVDLSALSETVGAGRIVSGAIRNPKTQKKWLDALFEVMGNKKLWQQESKKAQEWAKSFSWDSQAKKWTDVFNSPSPTPLVTIFTPTIREGFWNLMANNIAVQTYKNVEWLIVDDHPSDRSEIASKYATEYGLNIRYYKGKTRKRKRTYSLVNANNTALQHAKGEILLFLQDFVLMPPTGVEQVVQAYNHHPNDLIAMPDVYYAPKVAPDRMNKEDWFQGEVDVAGKFLRSNQRILNLGFRESTSYYDWEANYGAIPTKVAKELGGWYEFFDEALGFDNTEMAFRALATGHKIYIDEGNVALCIDHWGVLGVDEGGKGVNRRRRLNDPRFEFLVQSLKKGKLPVVREQSIDDQIDLQFTIPKEVPDLKCDKWVRQNQEAIAGKWMGEIWG